METLLVNRFAEIDVLDEGLYDFNRSQFAWDLFRQSNQILEKRVSRLMQASPAFIDFSKHINPPEQFDVRMSKKARDMLKSGEWVFKYSRKNGYVPILSDRSGRWTEQVVLDLKKVSPELNSALTNLSMQQQLGELLEQMEMLNNAIQRVERGQRDDRIGLLFSARHQFIEAIGMSDGNFQTLALLNASRTANDARFQLMQTMRSDIDQIIHNRSLKKKERDALSNATREAMQYINEATGVCVMCFSALGEVKPMLAALKSYQCFIEQTLLAVDDEGLSRAEQLHRNWAGSDNEWLSIPQRISERVQRILDQRELIPVALIANQKEVSGDGNA